MSEEYGVTWAFEGRQLGVKSALALLRAVGFVGKDDLVTGVSVMTAESQRWTAAWHYNHTDIQGHDIFSVASTDHGLMQLSRDGQEKDVELFVPKTNAKLARKLYLARGWQPWAAYNSGAYLQFVPEVEKKYDRGTWRLMVPRWKAA